MPEAVARPGSEAPEGVEREDRVVGRATHVDAGELVGEVVRVRGDAGRGLGVAGHVADSVVAEVLPAGTVVDPDQLVGAVVFSGEGGHPACLLGQAVAVAVVGVGAVRGSAEAAARGHPVARVIGEGLGARPRVARRRPGSCGPRW